jgi:hypothetical protein
MGGNNMDKVKRLSRQSLDIACRHIMGLGRPLEKALCMERFSGGDRHGILNELVKFQNGDGGFGNGMEPDFRLPLSSPMATHVGIRQLTELDNLGDAREPIRHAVEYYEASFNSERNGWFAASREVNGYPHAPWWHFNEEEGMTIIDRNWGNPSAGITAFLYKYSQYLKRVDIDSLVEFAIDYITHKEKFNSEAEVSCYIRLYEVLPPHLKARLEKRIESAISQVIEYDSSHWEEYVPRPLRFVLSPGKPLFGIPVSKIEENLDFYAELLSSKGKIEPPWGRSYYEGDLNIAYDEWQGILTLDALTVLDNYGRIER